MRKIIIIAILCLGMLLTGCGKYEDAECGGYFTKVSDWKDGENIYEIVYANDTKVKYLIWRTAYKGNITPLYNADGSLQVYEESEE